MSIGIYKAFSMKTFYLSYIIILCASLNRANIIILVLGYKNQNEPTKPKIK